MNKPIVQYLRVSTKEQEESNLGLEGQRYANKTFADKHGYEIVSTCEDIASGGLDLSYRKGLESALDLAKKLKCPVLVSKLDRLSRDTAFISKLMKEKVPFITVLFGLDVDPMMLHITAAVAEKERKTIGERTSAALQAKKRMNTGWVPGAATTEKGKAKQIAGRLSGGESTKELAVTFAACVFPMIKRCLDQGLSYAAIASEMNTAKTPTSRRRKWYAATVRNVALRMAA